MVADVGGTNARIGLFDESEGEFHAVQEYRNRDYSCLEDVIDQWLCELREPAPARGCIAVAAPRSGDTVSMSNMGWSFSCRALAERYEFKQFSRLNDFQANAHALPYLGSNDLEVISAGDARGHTSLATVGPGTGLGGATLQWVDGRAVAGDSEPGHAGLSPATDLEVEIFKLLLPEYGNIYAELLLSGAGLARLYHSIARINGVSPEALQPAEVSQRALESKDPHCVQALDTFCALLGSASGDFILSSGAYGGLFIAGGIVPRMIDFLRSSDFLSRISAKGGMGQHLGPVPVQVITAPYPGLIGAAHAPL